MSAIRVVLPFHLRTLARITGDEVELEVGVATLGAVLDAVEARYPVLRGAIREEGTLRRRPFVRYFACQEDFSHEPAETPLPAAVISREEPLMIIGAMAGG